MRKRIFFTEQAKNDLRAIDQTIAMRILQGIDRLSATGHGDVNRLQGVEPPEYRLRIGGYRVRYVDEGDTIRTLSVKHRSTAYR